MGAGVPRLSPPCTLSSCLRTPIVLPLMQQQRCTDAAVQGPGMRQQDAPALPPAACCANTARGRKGGSALFFAYKSPIALQTHQFNFPFHPSKVPTPPTALPPTSAHPLPPPHLPPDGPTAKMQATIARTSTISGFSAATRSTAAARPRCLPAYKAAVKCQASGGSRDHPLPLPDHCLPPRLQHPRAPHVGVAMST